MQKAEAHDATRKRSPNFTRRENKLLAELVQVYQEQIERKKTDHASNVEKNRAWQELAKDFNGRLGGDPYRSATVLKHRYENVKKDVRRNVRKGQVPVKDIMEDQNNEVDIKEIISLKLVNQEDFVGLNDDSVSLTSKVEKFSDEPFSSFEDMQQKCIFEEHSLRLQHMKEQHELKLELIRQEHGERMRILRQEHNAKMEQLELEKTINKI